MSLPQESRVVIIGGGVIGCSIAYHLSKRGWKDVLILERLQLTHGTTWHAAGLVGQLRSSSNLTRLMRYGAQLYGELEKETGQATGWRKVGSLRLAASQERWMEIERAATMSKGFGLEIELISPRKAQELFPLLQTNGLVGAAWIESDGYVDPTSLTNAYAAGARARGVKIIQNIRVTNVIRDGRRVTGVATDQGTIKADYVVNAAGMWGSDVARMAGTRVPVCAVEHQYLVTEKTDRIPANLPTLRDPDARFYVKPEPGALCVGGWEDATVPFGERGMPMDFGPELLPPNFDRFEQYGLDAAERAIPSRCTTPTASRSGSELPPIRRAECRVRSPASRCALRGWLTPGQMRAQKGRASLPAFDSTATGRGRLPRIRRHRLPRSSRWLELVADLHSEHPRTQRHFRLDELRRGGERTGVRIAQVLAEE